MSTTRWIQVLLAAFVQLGLGVPVAAQDAAAADKAPKRPSRLGTDAWCEDATTVCITGRESRMAFSGLRFVFEPQLGVLIQNGDNKFDNTNFRSLEKIGLATNLVGRWVGLQTLFVYPSSIQFDEQSPLRVNKQLVDGTDGKVDVEWGMTIGLTAVDGVLSLGFGFLNYDQRDFTESARADKSNARDSFFYVNIQAVEALKGAIKTFRR
jgi:hypothetical protein